MNSWARLRFAVVSLAWVASLGCAQFPGSESFGRLSIDDLTPSGLRFALPFERSAHDPDDAPNASPKGIATVETPCEWIAHTKAGRSALANGELELAEASYESAIECTADLPSRDIRIRTSLGRLVMVAATHQKVGNVQDADRLMKRTREIASQRHLSPSVIEYLELRYTELIVPEPRFERHRVPTPRFVPRNRHSYDRLIRNAAAKFNVDAALVKAVVAAESNFDQNAISPVGAQGLMQLMPATAREMGVRFAFDPHQNLTGGVRYLRSMMDRYGETKLALAAYNAGPEAVDRYGGIPPYRETQEYVKRVLRFYSNYQVSWPTPSDAKLSSTSGEAIGSSMGSSRVPALAPGVGFLLDSGS